MINGKTKLDKFLTEEGLMPTNLLFYIKNHAFPSESYFSIRQEPNLKIYPVSEVWRVVGYIIDKKYLWEQAEIRVKDNKPGPSARAPIIAVPFHMAVEMVLRHHYKQQGKFYAAELDDPLAYKVIGFTAILLFMVNRMKGDPNKIELQAWECYGNEPEVFYIHGEILNLRNKLIFTHLDGAFIYLDDVQKAELFGGNSDVKGPKEKYFRFGKAGVEAKVPYKDAVELIRAFFPVDEITNEAFNVKVFNNNSGRRA